MNVPAPFLNTVDASWNRFEEPALLLQAVAGSARVKLGPNFPGGDTSPTGLVALTTYTASVVVDGVVEPVSILGSAALTVAGLLTELNADLSATVTLDGDELVFTSPTTGANSSVFISDTGANFLFASLRGDTDAGTTSVEHWGVVDYDSTRGWFNIAGSTNRVGRSERGHSFYLRWDKLDGGHQEQLSAVIDAFLAGGVANTNQPWVNAAAGISMTPVATAGSQTVTMDVAVAAGDTALSTPGTYYFKVATDGGAITEYSIVIAGVTTYTATAALLDAAWPLGTVTFDDANDRFVFTSGTTGASSSVSVTAGTTGTDVFAQIVTDGTPTGFTINAAVAGDNGATLFTETGLSRSTVYQLQLNVNGDGNVTVYVDLNIPQTTGASFDQLMAAINAGLAAARRADGSALPVVAEWRQGYSATQPTEIVFRVLTSNELFTATSAGAVEMGAATSLVLTDGLVNPLVAALAAAFTAAIDTAQAGFGVVNFNRVNAAAVTPTTVPAVATTNYSITVKVDGGAATNYVIAGVNTDTMAVLAGKIAAATGLTVEAVGNKFILNSATATGAGVVEVVIPTAGPNPDLFNAIAAALDVVDPRGDTSVQTWSVYGFATPGIDGATNLAFPKTVDSIVYASWERVLDTAQVGGRIAGQYIHGLTGYGPLFTSDSAASFEKELRPQSTGECVYGALYWDGAAWRYFVAGDASRLNTDDVSAGTNNPPRTLMRGV